MSVVIAAFNRSNVLKYALESVRAQTFEDWEVLVVGDHCTDDSQSVADSFGDPRIRFVNLPHNMGDQSGPNSVGVRLGRGELISFLSQDDLWCRDHLGNLAQTLDATGADMVVSSGFIVGSLSVNPAGDLAGEVEVVTRDPDASVQPFENFVASGWMLTARLAERIGDWKAASSVRFHSSQEYLYRCWSAGATIRFSPATSFVRLPSIASPDAYATARDAEHRIVAPIVIQDDLKSLDALATRLPAPSATESVRASAESDRNLKGLRLGIARRGDRIFARTFVAAMRLGWAPWEFRAAIAGVPRGGANAVLRRIRGLPVEPDKN